MVNINAIAFVALLPPSVALADAKPCPPCSPKPPAFILAGDSTTAVQSAGGGGWGNGFLSFLRAPPAWGVNKGHNGATTVSFVQGGDWANVTRLIDEKNAEGFQVWVTVQFGHNDQVGSGSLRIGMNYDQLTIPPRNPTRTSPSPNTPPTSPPSPAPSAGTTPTPSSSPP